MKNTAIAADSSIVHSQLHVPPILRIPLEITSKIFQHCLPEDEFPRPAVKCAPIQLTQVCSVWRELAIGTPHLWSNVLLSSAHDFEGTNEPFTDKLAHHSKALEVWMTRATPLLLSVQIRYPTLPQLPEPALKIEALPPVFLVMAINVTRLKSVSLSLPQDYLGFAWITTHLDASNMESFNIDDTSIPKSRPEYSKHPAVLQADTAETLKALSVRASIVYARTAVTAFVRLRTLSLQHSRPKNCLHLLRYCPVLEDLSLSFYDVHHSTFLFDHPTILLPLLRNFHLSHTGNSENGDSPILAELAGEIGLLLDSLQLPRLQTFHLWMTIKGSARYNDPNLPWDYLARLITRSNCSLHTLELRSSHIDTPSILQILGLSPDLKYLGIRADEELERNVA